MTYQGNLTAVGPAKVVEGQYGQTTYNTIQVENQTITGKRMGMVLACRTPYAEKVQQLFAQSAQFGTHAQVEVDFEPVLREYEKDGVKKTIAENVVLNIRNLN